MKIDEIAIKRIIEKREGIGPTGYGAEDEKISTLIGNAIATGVAAKIIKKLLIKHVPKRVAMFIPGFGAGVGLYFAGKKVADGDYVGAALETGIGFAGGSVKFAALGVLGIAAMIFREFYKELNPTGNYPSGDLWHGEPSQHIFDQAMETYKFMPLIWPIIYNGTIDTIQEMLDHLPFRIELNKYVERYKIAAEEQQTKETKTDEDVLLNDIFSLAFGKKIA